LKNISSNEGSGVADERDIVPKYDSTENAYHDFILQEKTSSMSIKDEESKDESYENTPSSKLDPKNIKFILFQS
jgi:hypothetical protein